jgi:hypothetical protein
VILLTFLTSDKDGFNQERTKEIKNLLFCEAVAISLSIFAIFGYLLGMGGCL